MSRWVRALRRRRRAGQGGFTLIEVIVALSLVSIAAAGSVPLLITGLRSAVTSRLNTQAKNLAQQRFESMRDLQFHVDHQNGPFVDLLDIYYTNLTTTATTRTRANEVEVGKWISSGASAPDPSGPFYQVSVAQLPGNTSFSQTIDTQFLSVSGQPVAASTFTGYDSQSEGHDQPPSSMVGVTVITTWTDHGVSHSYTSYTRIADGRGLTSTLTSQADAELLRVSSTGSAGNALTVDVASAEANGSFSTGSVASADVKALEADDAAGQDYLGASGSAVSGGNQPGTIQGTAFTQGGPNACGWIGVGPTQATNVTAAIGTGALPQVPYNVDTNSPPNTQLTAQLMTAGSGQCGIFGFNNQSTSYDPNLMLTGTPPLVQVANDSGNTVAATGSAWVNTTSAATLPHSVTSGANTSSSDAVRLFPNASFTGGAGVVQFVLNQASLSCSATSNNGTVTNAASGSWSVTVKYWKAKDTDGNGQLVTLGTYTWNSATDSGSADPLASLDPSTVVVYQKDSTVLHLSDYIASWNTQRKLVENPSSGLHQLNGIVSVTTKPVRAGDIISAVGMQLGNLSCAADDER